MSLRRVPDLEALCMADSGMVGGSIADATTRRELLRRLMAGGAALTLSGGLPDLVQTAFAEEPERGGRIRVALPAVSTADTVDPAKQSFAADYVRCNMFYNGLFSLDASLTPQLALAETVRDVGAKVWTITLRKDVTFHDGKTLDAEDVVYSLNRHKDPAVGSKAKALVNQVVEVKAIGAREVQITLSAPNADLPVILGTFHFHIVKAGTTDFTTAIGTGPFRCKSFEPGVRTIGTRYENYWRQGRPYLDEIEVFGIQNEQARINALLSGDIEVASNVNPRSVRRITKTPGFEVFETKSGYYTDFAMQLNRAPGNNPYFVLAMKHLMDRELMRDAILRGHAVVASDQPIDPTNRFYFAGLPQRPYDPDRAKFHLKRSGIGISTIPIVCSSAAENSVDIALLLQQSALEIGLDLDVQEMPSDGYWSNQWLKRAVCFGTVNPRPSADVLLTLFFRSTAAWNESAWKNVAFDQLLDAARAETEEGKRRQMYADMQILIAEQAGVGIPLFLNLLDGHVARLKGFAPVPLGSLMGFGFAEHVWLDA